MINDCSNLAGLSACFVYSLVMSMDTKYRGQFDFPSTAASVIWVCGRTQLEWKKSRLIKSFKWFALVSFEKKIVFGRRFMIWISNFVINYFIRNRVERAENWDWVKLFYGKVPINFYVATQMLPFTDINWTHCDCFLQKLIYVLFYWLDYVKV